MSNATTIITVTNNTVQEHTSRRKCLNYLDVITRYMERSNEWWRWQQPMVDQSSLLHALRTKCYIPEVSQGRNSHGVVEERSAPTLFSVVALCWLLGCFRSGKSPLRFPLAMYAPRMIIEPKLDAKFSFYDQDANIYGLMDIILKCWLKFHELRTEHTSRVWFCFDRWRAI